MDLREYNRHAWDRAVQEGDQWTVPVGPEIIDADCLAACPAARCWPRPRTVPCPTPTHHPEGICLTWRSRQGENA
jgi:hypothetical protein